MWDFPEIRFSHAEPGLNYQTRKIESWSVLGYIIYWGKRELFSVLIPQRKYIKNQNLVRTSKGKTSTSEGDPKYLPKIEVSIEYVCERWNLSNLFFFFWTKELVKLRL